MCHIKQLESRLTDALDLLALLALLTLLSLLASDVLLALHELLELLALHELLALIGFGKNIYNMLMSAVFNICNITIFCVCGS